LGYITGALEERIANANLTLNEALDLAGRGMVDDAAKKLGEARRIVAGLSGEINRIAKAEAARRVERFAENALRRLTELQNKTDELKIPPQAAAAVKSALENARGHIERAKRLAEEKNTGSAVKELEDMAREAKKGSDRLKEEFPAVSNRLKGVVKQMESRIESIERQISRLGRGDVAVANEKLREARDLLNQAVEDLEKGNVEAANKLIKKAMGLVDEVEDMFKELIRRQGEGERQGGDRGDRRKT